MRLLKELALGNISPLELHIKPDSVYQKLLSKVIDSQSKLAQTLSPEQEELLDEISDANNKFAVESEEEAFVKGFVLGAQMMMEIMTADLLDNTAR